MRILKNLVLLLCFASTFSADIHGQSVAKEWNELNLFAVRNGFARPTVIARDLWHVSAGMYDAWCVYDAISRPYFLGQTVGSYTTPFNGIEIPATEAEIELARNEAVSFTAYRILSHRYSNLPSTNEDFVLQAFDDKMAELGYDINNTSTDYSSGSPAALGNYIAEQVIAYGMTDGSNEIDDYDNTYYEPVNAPLVTQFDGNPDITDPNRWQPLTLIVAIDQLGNPLPINTPDFLGPEWGNVVPFSLTDDDKTIQERDGNFYQVYCDPGAPPMIDTINHETGLTDPYKWNFSMVAVWSSLLDPTDGTMIDISPGGIGNNMAYPASPDDYGDFYNYFTGLDASQGYDINPATGEAYDPQIVPLGDYGRVLAEFWADGPDSETPPGHWFEIMNHVNEHPELEKRWAGEGPLIDDLEWDIKTYFALGGAMHDCAIAAWGIKGYYDYVRPISAIRYMGDQGQSSDQMLPNYSKAGLPLIPGYIELVEDGDELEGDDQEHLNKIKVKSWKGPDYLDQINLQGNIIDGVQDSTNAGVGWVLTEDWWPYQRPSFVSPPFAGYISGHSTYSRAAAEVLARVTGDEYFPGGMGVFPAPVNDFLVFEEGPSVDLELQWAKYVDASDQCSLSRIFGGIHPPADDIPGRIIGQKIGERVFDLATYYANPAEPRIIFSELNSNLINDDYVGTDFTIEVIFNQAMDLTSVPDLDFNEDLSGTLTLVSQNWIGDDRYTWTFSTTDTGMTNMNILTTVSGAMDLDGDTQEEYTITDGFSIDTENPSIASALFGSDINESSVGNNMNLTLLFNEDVQVTTPTVTFTNEDPTVNSLVLQLGQPEWVAPNEYGIAYLVNDADEELYEMTLQVGNITDLSGNDIILEDVVIGSILDTKVPSVLLMTPSASVINESQVGDEQFSISVDFDDNLNTTQPPVLSFPLEDPSMTLVWNELASSFTNGDSTYVYVFNVIDADQELSNIDVQISGIIDDALNSSEDEITMDAVNIDTKAPELTEAIYSIATITDAETGMDLDITLTFDEPVMENPIGLSFDPSLPLSLTVSSEMWLTSMIYQAEYSISDENEEEELTVSYAPVVDLAGNTSINNTLNEVIILDNKNPGALVTANTYNVTTGNQANGFKVFVTFDETVDQTVIPQIEFPVEDPSTQMTLTANSDWFGSTYVFDYSVDDLTPLPYIDLTISGAVDTYGNPMVSTDLIDFFSLQLDTFLTVNELELKEIKVFPNPVSFGQAFIVETEHISAYALEVYDYAGRKIETVWNQTSESQFEVSTLGLASGKYFIKLIGEASHSVLRIEVLN